MRPVPTSKPFTFVEQVFTGKMPFLTKYLMENVIIPDQLKVFLNQKH